MAHSSNDRENKKTLEIKQNFLASAISDISTYIQLTDTKVSIIMGAVVAILVGIAAVSYTHLTLPTTSRV